jgi:hypothetical protein
MRGGHCLQHTAITRSVIVTNKNSSPAALAIAYLRSRQALTVVASGPDESTSATPTQRPAVSAEANARRMRLQGSSSPRLGGADSGSKPPLPYPICAGAFWFVSGGVDSFISIKEDIDEIPIPWSGPWR